MTCRACEKRSSAPPQCCGAYNLRCLQCCAALVEKAPGKRGKEAMLAAIRSFLDSPGRDAVLAEVRALRARRRNVTQRHAMSRDVTLDKDTDKDKEIPTNQPTRARAPDPVPQKLQTR